MSGPVQPLQERRALNEGIEDAFIETARYAAGIRTFNVIHRGVIIDLYEMFYYNFAILVELTEGVEGLEKDGGKEVIGNVRTWLSENNYSRSEADIKRRCESGLELFSRFKVVMSNRGLLSLPSRGR